MQIKWENRRNNVHLTQTKNSESNSAINLRVKKRTC